MMNIDSSYPHITMEQIEDAIKKAFKEHQKYTYMLCIGFVSRDDVDDNNILVVEHKAYNQNGNTIVLTKAGSRFHKYIREIEDKEDIQFERLTDEMMRRIQINCKIIFTDESGEFKNLYEDTTEPIRIPIPETYKGTAIYFNNQYGLCSFMPNCAI